MAKNNALINKYKFMHQKIQQLAPDIYSAMAIALHRKYGWGYKRINDLFVETELIWTDCANSNLNMAQICEEETGIEILKKVNGK